MLNNFNFCIISINQIQKGEFFEISELQISSNPLILCASSASVCQCLVVPWHFPYLNSPHMIAEYVKQETTPSIEGAFICTLQNNVHIV